MSERRGSGGEATDADARELQRVIQDVLSPAAMGGGGGGERRDPSGLPVDVELEATLTSDGLGSALA